MNIEVGLFTAGAVMDDDLFMLKSNPNMTKIVEYIVSAEFPANNDFVAEEALSLLFSACYEFKENNE